MSAVVRDPCPLLHGPGEACPEFQEDPQDDNVTGCRLCGHNPECHGQPPPLEQVIQCLGDCDRHYWVSMEQAEAMARGGASCAVCDGPLQNMHTGRRLPPRPDPHLKKDGDA